MMLFFTGFSRTASEIAVHQIKNIPKKRQELSTMYDMAHHALNLLQKDRLVDFGKLLYESWKLKRSLSSKISTEHIDQIMTNAKKAGAYGGKLLGAGGGGFVLVFAPPSRHEKIREKLKKLL